MKMKIFSVFMICQILGATLFSFHSQAMNLEDLLNKKTEIPKKRGREDEGDGLPPPKKPKGNENKGYPRIQMSSILETYPRIEVSSLLIHSNENNKGEDKDITREENNNSNNYYPQDRENISLSNNNPPQEELRPFINEKTILKLAMFTSEIKSELPKKVQYPGLFGMFLEENQMCSVIDDGTDTPFISFTEALNLCKASEEIKEVLEDTGWLPSYYLPSVFRMKYFALQNDPILLDKVVKYCQDNTKTLEELDIKFPHGRKNYR